MPIVQIHQLTVHDSGGGGNADFEYPSKPDESEGWH